MIYIDDCSGGKLNCSKKLRTSIMDCSVSTKRLVSSAYCDNLVFFLVWHGVSHKFAIIFNVKIEKRRRDKGHPCLTPLDKEKEVEGKPLLEPIACFGTVF